MALDFPASPATGATYTGPNGVIWQFDGAKWLSGTGTTVYAPITDAALLGNPTAPTPAAGDADTSIATTAFVTNAVATSLHDVGRNYLHNSMMNVAQRGAGAFTTNATASLDRWALSFNLDTMSITQSPASDSDRTAIGDEETKYFLTNVFTGNAGASAFSSLIQRIENLRRLAGKTVVVSFWARATSGTPKLGINLRHAFGTGGSPSANYWVLPTGNSVTLSTTWTRYSTVIVIPSVSGKTIGTNNDDSTGLGFWFSSGSDNIAFAGNIGVQSSTIQLWGVQLELGTVATPLEKLDPVTQLQQCQRFYQVGQAVAGGYSAAAVNAQMTLALPVTMRGLPGAISITVTANNDLSLTSPSQNGLTGGMILFGGATPAGAVAWGINRTFTASADL